MSICSEQSRSFIPFFLRSFSAATEQK